MKRDNSRFVLDEKDPRLESIEHMGMLSMDLFIREFGVGQLLNIFGTRHFYSGDVNGDGGCSDPYRSYSQNSLGCRGSAEFDHYVDLIAIGCSQTFGLGIDEEAMWSKSLADKLGMSYATIAASGWSVQEMVSSAMYHIRKYGKPKVIAALLPDFGRTVFVEHKTLFRDRNDQPHDYFAGTVRVRGFHYDGGGGADYPKISKAPHLANDVVPREAAIFLAAQTWAAFIEYCHVAGIELLWTSWEKTINEVYGIVKEISLDSEANREGVSIDTSGFIYNELTTYGKEHISKLKAMSCHEDLKAKWPESFDVGTDKCEHYGAHAHAHIAELFVEKYNCVNG